MPLKTEKQSVTPLAVALTWFKNEYFKHDPEVTIDEAAEIVVELAMSHPKQVAGWMDSFIAYRNAEGFTGDESACAALWRSRLENVPEYKATRRKLERGPR